MKSMYRKALAAAALCGMSANAQAADFIFSFVSDPADPNTTNAVAGTVTGRIIGLPEDGTSSALQVFIDSYSPEPALAYPIEATAWFWQFENSFTVSGGTIVAAIFLADDDFGPSFDRLYINVPIYESGGTNYASLGSNNAVSVWNNQGLGGVTFSRIDGAVPEPGTWVMMLLGFGAAGYSIRRARRPHSVQYAA